MPNHQNAGTPYYSSANTNYAPHPVAPETALIAIGPLLATLWQRKFLIVTTTLVFVGLALLYVFITPSTYTAKGVIVIDPRQVQVLDSAGVLSGIGANSAAISSQVEIIQSRTLVHEVFIEQGYINDPEFAQPRLLSRLFGFLSPAEPVTEAKIFNNFWKRLEVERQGLTYVLSITFKSEDRQKAADVVNAIIARYLSSQVDEKSGANAEVSVLLNAQLDGLRAELSAKEAAVENFKVSHNILNVGAGQTLLQNQIQQLSAQLVVAREQARAANNRHLQVASVHPDTDPLPSLFEYLTDTTSTSLRANYTASSMALSSLQASLGSRHPNIIVAAAELARLDKLIRNEVKTVLAQISKENDLAQTNVKNAEAALEAMSTQNAVSNQDEVELRQLERQADGTRQVLEQLINREQETDQLENLQRSDARIISKAVAPILATWPKATLLLAIATIFGLGLGGAIALYLGPKPLRQTRARNQLQDENQVAAHPVPAQFQYHDQLAQSQPHQMPNHQTQTFAHTPPPPQEQPSQFQNANYGDANYQEADFRASNLHNGQASEVSREASMYHSAEQVPGFTASPSRENPQAAQQLWARRAAGEPYTAPPNTTSNAQPAAPHKQIHPRGESRQFDDNALRRESFVAGLKRRRNQHLPQ